MKKNNRITKKQLIYTAHRSSIQTCQTRGVIYQPAHVTTSIAFSLTRGFADVNCKTPPQDEAYMLRRFILDKRAENEDKHKALVKMSAS
jgi:hypothetical protein